MKIEPLSTHDSAQVSKLISRIRCLKNYAYLWQTADSFASEPLTQAITVVSQCLEILDDIKKVYIIVVSLFSFSSQLF
jgi:hypothetical protein